MMTISRSWPATFLGYERHQQQRQDHTLGDELNQPEALAADRFDKRQNEHGDKTDARQYQKRLPDGSRGNVAGNPRPHERRHQQQDQEDPQQQQQQLFEQNLAPGILPEFKELHRSPLDDVIAFLAEQVSQNRKRDSQRTEQHKGIDDIHRRAVSRGVWAVFGENRSRPRNSFYADGRRNGSRMSTSRSDCRS